ncbi:MAG TPA: Ig-like domain-containing protein [Candidatus Dormibacteraeota bacterium]|nr:Ig-like domain-containing protein [Candidatus Dormibacteraeota bacterium]
MTRRVWPLALAALLAVAAVALLTGCGSPPQVVEIAPQRGAVDVRSNEPVRVRFDRPMDHGSVAAHFRVEPAAQGSLAWTSAGELTFEHAPLSPATQYRVVLDAGYRDAQGMANPLRHSWTFRTESAPNLAGSAPGMGDRDIDPASYISLTFSRQMDPGSLTAAIGLSPAVPFAIHPDGSDPLRVILAPQALLEARTSYTVTVGPGARDIDGNHLGAGSIVSFTTGDFRPLKHWIGFIAEATPGTGGAGVWVVNENRLPRPLITNAVSAFTWSPEGSRLLLRSPAGGWTDQPLDGPGTTLPITAEWADFLAPGRGYAFLEQGRLGVLRPDGSQVTVATGVTSASVAPGAVRLAFAVRDVARSDRASEIDGYDTELGTRYRLQTEADPVDGLSWSPDGQSLAYRLLTADTARHQVRVRSLRDGGAAIVATGDVSAPVWQADRQHVFFTASVPSPAGAVTRVFRFAVNDGPHALSPSAGMPAGQDVQVEQLSPSPDGHQLAFLGDDAAGRPGVWTMNVDGTGVTRLTDADLARFPYDSRDVAWTPG